MITTIIKTSSVSKKEKTRDGKITKGVCHMWNKIGSKSISYGRC